LAPNSAAFQHHVNDFAALLIVKIILNQTLLNVTRFFLARIAAAKLASHLCLFDYLSECPSNDLFPLCFSSMSNHSVRFHFQTVGG
jgi:hypothetical protein